MWGQADLHTATLKRPSVTHYGPSGGWPGAGILQCLLSELRSLIRPTETSRMIGLLAPDSVELGTQPVFGGLCLAIQSG